MNATNRAIAIVASVVIVAVCLVFALAQTSHGINLNFGGRNIDETKTDELGANNNLTIDSAFSGVNVTVDASAETLTAHLYGSVSGLDLGSDQELEITRSGDTVTVKAGRNWGGHIGWSANLKLDIVIPQNFSGGFDCSSSAGAVEINSDMTVKTFRAHSSAGSVKTQNVKAVGHLEISSSAGGIDAGAVEAGSADISSTAGGVRVESCAATAVSLHSSAGSVSAGELSGTLNVSSSAGSVNVTIKDVADSAEISSSASSVTVSLPSGMNADLVAWSSAGSVSVGDLRLSSVSTQKHDRVEGKMGSGGPKITIHSSAGSVNVNGN